VFAEIVVGRNVTWIHVENFPAPFFYHVIDIHDEQNNLVDLAKVCCDKNHKSSPWISTYEFQLHAFVKAVQGDTLALQQVKESGSPHEAVQNMQAIDMIYRAAGVEPRKGPAISQQIFQKTRSKASSRLLLASCLCEVHSCSNVASGDSGKHHAAMHELNKTGPW
jgi:hypothetical protein